jgi:hypothetical protein
VRTAISVAGVKVLALFACTRDQGNRNRTMKETKEVTRVGSKAAYRRLWSR